MREAIVPHRKEIAFGTVIAAVIGAVVVSHHSSSPTPLPLPPPSHISQAPSQAPHPSHTLTRPHRHIVTTVFWAGEPGDTDNGGIPNIASAWDEKWSEHYGGVDSHDSRNGYNPSGFTPRENPFYIALPYNDLDTAGARKSSAAQCLPWQPRYDSRYSACKNIWIAIQHNGRTAYAQWEDVGPFGENDTPYVFDTAAPANTRDEKAGLDVSPAVRDYLGLGDVDYTDWQFTLARDVPSGPWKQIVTTSRGDAL